MLKKVILLMAVMFSLFLLICALLPSTYRVERNIFIQAQDSLIYEQISDFRNWPTWSAWSSRDPDAKNTFLGTPSEVGQLWKWEGEIVGVGQMKHQEVEALKEVQSELDFFEPQPMKARSIVNMEKTPNGYRVRMILEGTLGYPIERLFGLAIDDIIGPDFEEGLNTLKQKLENETKNEE